MRKYFYVGAIMALFAASCNNAEPAASAEKADMPMGGTEVAANDNEAKPVKMDPVCEMEWDSNWTESTVYMGDTIGFCSENCKTAFLARPEKYIKAK
jgi:YHS domain-containing protein